MGNNQKRSNRFPGTDDRTGWPLVVNVLCGKDFDQLCHLALNGMLLECVYEPVACPFFGRLPRLAGATDGLNTEKMYPTTEKPTQGRILAVQRVFDG